MFIAYNSTILIDVLPYGRVYTSIKLSVYDNISKVWSSEYEWKKEIDTRISTFICYPDNLENKKMGFFL